jgi:hypothetical protein
MINKTKVHLKTVRSNYLEHMLAAWRISLICLWASFTSIIHSLFPNIFTHTTSNTIKKLNLFLQTRKDNK